MRKTGLGLVLAMAVVLTPGCGKPREAALAATPVAPSPALSPSPSPSAAPVQATYSSGLGELMGLAQMRHSKMWFAAQAGNWKLAAYELDEMKEGFADVVKYFPTHKQSPVPIDQAIETMMTEPLSDLGKAIEKKDKKLFETAYDTVTDGCNACHQATDYGFLVVQRPKANPYSNQVFPPQP
ncbi:MAG TPA: hypothetical protein VGK26_02720 [Thermoanaerobaculia bacterium]